MLVEQRAVQALDDAVGLRPADAGALWAAGRGGWPGGKAWMPACAGMTVGAEAGGGEAVLVAVRDAREIASSLRFSQ